jgi:hypothetical protein
LGFFRRAFSVLLPVSFNRLQSSSVSHTLPAGYLIDPADPRAPSAEQWEAMTPAERARVVDALPTRSG